MNRQSWTYEEDQAISKLVSEFGFNDWTKIAQKLKENYAIGKRTGKQCRERWYNHLNPAVNKKPWNNEQEERLFQLHKIYGNRWKDISRQFTGRTDNDIKNHFYSTLRRSLRRLNKILGQKNSTSQMREIKPSVLSTIMNYLYEQEHGIENDLLRSLKDLPSLIFQFANFKPIKTNLKLTRVEDAKQKISDIFQLINRFNEEYEQNKIEKQTLKHIKRTHSRKQQKQCSTQCSPNSQNELLQCATADSLNMNQFSFLIRSSTETTEACISQQLQKNESLMLIKQEEVSLLQEENQELSEEYIVKQGAYRSRNMSLQDDEMALIQMQDLQQPSRVSVNGDGLDLTVVGHHWQPQSWQRQIEIKEFVDQVLEIHYEDPNKKI